jgi:site-specific recombinase XerD
LLGHSSIVTTQIYSHSDLDSLQKAVRKFDEPIQAV